MSHSCQKKRIEHDHLGKLLATVAKIDERLDENALQQPNTLIRAVSKGENVLGLNFSSLSASEAKRSTNLLKFWYEMTRGRTVDAGKIHGFLECLGFTVKACKPHGDHFVTASVKPLQSKELCPVPAFWVRREWALRNRLKLAFASGSTNRSIGLRQPQPVRDRFSFRQTVK